VRHCDDAGIEDEETMARFWVVGGEYKDTSFDHTINGENWFGPFDRYEEAKKVWQEQAWKTVDDATTRYRIERIDPEEPPRCTD
jgi:hypothetical protein